MKHQFGWRMILTVASLAAAQASAQEMAAISSRARADYVRQRRADGALVPEPYVFGEGGYFHGNASDPAADKMTFLQVARTLAEPLRRRGYVPGADRKTLKFLIMVYWGTTLTPGSPGQSVAWSNLSSASLVAAQANSAAAAVQPPAGRNSAPNGSAAAAASAANSALDGALAQVGAEEHIREAKDAQTARLLGYDSVWQQSEGITGLLNHSRQEMLDDLEDDRYFVVLMAYDFQQMLQHKRKLVWETRFSIRAQRHEFDRELARMAAQASRYFGQDSGGLVRRNLPDANVDIGPLKVLPDRK